MTAILTSPRFLFRAETQPRPDDPKSVHPLDEYSLASRLSYLLWLSLPDEELTRLASQGELRRQLPSQVKPCDGTYSEIRKNRPRPLPSLSSRRTCCEPPTEPSRSSISAWRPSLE